MTEPDVSERPRTIFGPADMTDAQLEDWRTRLVVDVRYDVELRETLNEVEEEIARRLAQGTHELT